MIPWAKPVFLGNESRYLQEALESTWISGGKFVDRFETEFTKAMGARHAVGVSNGTTALHLAMLSAGIGPGDEVIVPNFTFVAPGNTVIMCGAKPVFADIDPGTWCIDPRDAESKITKRTKAIVPVHVYGNVCDMPALDEVRKRHGVMLIEDVAEAVFSRHGGRCAGTFGDYGCFSFQATKTITMGEGGAVLTNDSESDARMRKLRSHGMKEGKRYWHDVVGYNYRLTNMQAAIGCAQLERAHEMIMLKWRMLESYERRLKGADGIGMQLLTPGSEPVLWAVSVQLDDKRYPQGRDAVMDAMEKAGIETRPGFYPFTKLPMYGTKDRLSVSERIASHVVSLPSYAQIEEADIAYVCDTLLELRGG